MMTSREMEHLRKELAELQQDFAYLAQRIAKLENELDELPPPAVDDAPGLETTGPMAVNIESIDNVSANTADRQGASQVDQTQDLEFRIGGTWLNRVGVVAVVLGLAYFLKYSFDNQWIGPTARVLLGVLAGLAMLFLGEKLRTRYPLYAQGLLGGGSLALFFSVFASYQFYHLIAPVLAFLFLVVVMVNTVFLAVRHHSLPIGILGIIGGYATPFLIHTNQPSLWMLFSYLTLLTAGVLAVSMYRKWPVFQYLSFLFNQLIFSFVWFVSLWGGVGGHLAPLLSFVISLFILYLGVATVYNIRQKKKATFWDTGLITLNAFTFFLWSKPLLEATIFRDYLGYYAVLLALLYVYLGKMGHRLFKEDKPQVYSLFAISFVLITIAVPLQLTDFYIGIAWLFESVALVFIARQLVSVPMVYGGFTVLGLGLFVTWVEIINLVHEQTFFFNIPTLMIFSSLLAIILTIRLIRDVPFPSENRAILKGMMLALLFVGLTVENHHFFQLLHVKAFLSPEQLTLSGVWLLYALVLFLIGMRKDNRYLRYASLGLLAIIVIKAFFIDLANLATLFKILLFLFLGLCLLGISYLYQRKKVSVSGKEEQL